MPVGMQKEEEKETHEHAGWPFFILFDEGI